MIICPSRTKVAYKSNTHSLSLKKKEKQTADSAITSHKQNLSMARHVSMFPLQIMLTKGEGQAVPPSSPLLWEPRAPAHVAELGLYGSQWFSAKHTQTHQDVSLFVAGSHTPHHQLRKYVTVHCEDWGGGGEGAMAS